VPVLYLSGAKNKNMIEHLAKGEIGYLQSPGAGNSLQGVKVWAMDNGCFTGRYPGDDKYLELLGKYEEHRTRCLFVTVPDVIGDFRATLKTFPVMAARIREAGWPVALVAQDGMTEADVPWSQIDWLFVGGNTEWKLSVDCAALIAAAVQRGVKVHVGRVNSRKRYWKFAELGASTADGTFISFGPDANLPKVLAWQAEWGNRPVSLF
jgi:hypothetical protein